MSKVIRIPNDLHQRLADYAEGFDTPANVIERILNQYEHAAPEVADNDDVAPIAEVTSFVETPAVVEAAPVVELEEVAPVIEEIVQPEVQLEVQTNAVEESLIPITLHPDSEERFKKELLKIKKAKIRIFYQDGTTVDKTWNALTFDSESSVMECLHSRAEFHQDAWIRNGITHAEVSIDYTL